MLGFVNAKRRLDVTKTERGCRNVTLVWYVSSVAHFYLVCIRGDGVARVEVTSIIFLARLSFLLDTLRARGHAREILSDSCRKGLSCQNVTKYHLFGAKF